MRRRTDSQQSTPTFPRLRRPPRWLLAVMVAALVGVLAVSCGDGDQARDTAADLADTWVRAWNEDDPELMGSVFTEDGIYDDGVVFNEPDREFTRDEAIELVQDLGSTVTDVRRVGELTETGDDTFSFTCEFTVLGSQRSSTVEIELDGDLASRIEFLSSETIES